VTRKAVHSDRHRPRKWTPTSKSRTGGRRYRSCVSALLQGIDAAGSTAADWTNAVRSKKDDNIAKMAPRLMNNNSPMDYHGALARCAPSSRNAGRHPGQRRRTHSTSPAHHRHVPRASVDVALGVMGIGMAMPLRLRSRRKPYSRRRRQRFGFSGMEVETICRYNLRSASSSSTMTDLSRHRRQSTGVRRARPSSSRARATTDDGGVRRVASMPRLPMTQGAVNAAMDSAATLINAVLDPRRQRERPHRQPQPQSN